MQFLRRMVRGGMARMSSKKEIETAKKEKTTENINSASKLNNTKIMLITKSSPLTSYIKKQNTNWIAHVTRASYICICICVRRPTQLTRRRAQTPCPEHSPRWTPAETTLPPSGRKSSPLPFRPLLPFC